MGGSSVSLAVFVPAPCFSALCIQTVVAFLKRGARGVDSTDLPHGHVTLVFAQAL